MHCLNLSFTRIWLPVVLTEWIAISLLLLQRFNGVAILTLK